MDFWLVKQKADSENLDLGMKILKFYKIYWYLIMVRYTLSRILFSTPASIISFTMMWYVPDISNQMKTIWYLIFYCLYQTFLSVNIQKINLSYKKYIN